MEKWFCIFSSFFVFFVDISLSIREKGYDRVKQQVVLRLGWVLQSHIRLILPTIFLFPLHCVNISFKKSLPEKRKRTLQKGMADLTPGTTSKFITAAANSRYPNYIADREVLTRFFQEFRPDIFRDGPGVLAPDEAHLSKYQALALRVANRQTKLFPLALDDLANYGQLHLAQRIAMNLIGYQDEICRLVDSLIPYVPRIEDPIDQLQMDARAAGQALPVALTRRYELVVIPLSSLSAATPLRQLRGSMIGTLTVLRGVCISATSVKPKLVMLTSVCELCAESTFQQVIGDRLTPQLICQSQRCKIQNAVGRLLPQYKASKFVKLQELRLQELPEDVPRGAIPRTIRVLCEGEQTRIAAPGQVLRVVGTYIPDPATGQGHEAFRASTMVRTLYRALSVELEKRSYQEAAADMQDLMEEARAYHDRDALLDRLVHSIAPEIWGMEDVKKAMLCLLVGGASVGARGIRIRSDINILLMGDPGVAKSQLLKWVASTVPRSVFTTGKGSSGVGLTAAVTRDAHTGEVVLEGGALVLADRGVCCIDEFDKMEETDRTSLHEVMEQQSVSIAKAGIITTLNARTSILAASNPKFGRWKRNATPSENVNLPPALLSRFDILWLLLDEAERERDAELSMHVTYVHLHGVAPGRTAGATGTTATATQRNADGVSGELAEALHRGQHLSKDFLRAYIGEAKRVQPRMDPAAGKAITDLFCEMRSQSVRHSNVVTARTLLSLIRISQANARLRLSDRVTDVDVREAGRLLDCSKASLMERTGRGTTRTFSMSDAGVFMLIKEWVGRRQMVDVSELRTALSVKGITEAMLQKCFTTYSDVAVIRVEGGKLEFLS